MSAEDVASSADMVLVSLPTPPIVQSVCLDCVLKGSRVRTLIDLSTTGPTVAGVVAKAASARGVSWVDSPVSGGIGGATKGPGRDGVVQEGDVSGCRPGVEDIRQDVLRRRKAWARANRQARQQSAGRRGDRAVVGSRGHGRERASTRRRSATSSTPAADATARRKTSFPSR